ncbi:hypothetical protein [Onishia taeanensis]
MKPIDSSSVTQASIVGSAFVGWFLLAFVFLYIVLSPYYFFSSGEPQLCDYLILLGVFFTIIDISYRKVFFLTSSATAFTLLLIALSLWSLMVNLAWGLTLADSMRFIKNSQYIIFNSLLAFMLLYINDNYVVPVKKAVLYGFLVSVLILLLLQPYFESDFARARLSFNNPNQLAYFSLISFIVLSSVREETFYLGLRLLGCAISLWFLLISVSISALLSTIPIFILLFFYILKSVRSNPLLFAMLSMLSLLLALFIYAYFDVNQLINSMMNSQTGEIITSRAGRVDELVSNANEQRGYYRFFEYPEYLVFGAGQGFESRYGGMEIHSSFFSIWFYYGVPGLVLMFAILMFPLYRMTLPNIAVTASYSLYGITHLGWRFTLIWILISLLILKDPAGRGNEF